MYWTRCLASLAVAVLLAACAPTSAEPIALAQAPTSDAAPAAPAPAPGPPAEPLERLQEQTEELDALAEELAQLSDRLDAETKRQ